MTAESSSGAASPESPGRSNFIRDIIIEDIKAGRNNGRVQTRFPPEPNGYLHIGHAKAICLGFGLAEEFGGKCNLRFDDTNPSKEETEYVDSIMEDVRWLGFKWDGLFYASDYFAQLYEWAVQLIKAGKAYVCDLSADEVRRYRGTLTEPGKESPYRNRTLDENLDLFELMKKGEFPDGARTLRAKIDMASPNLNLRDPVMYRILHTEHHRTGNEWCIYPMYDYAHGQSDSIENVTHSICTLEFENNRPLYNWFIENLGIFPSRQFEFDRLNLTYTLLSKRKLLTLALEHFVREDLNKRAARVMAVLRPLKVIIDNYSDDLVEEMEAVNNPEDAGMGTRTVPFSKVLYIEQDDFKEDPPKGYFRLSPGREVRLRYGYLITCTNVVKNSRGDIVELHCTYDPATRGGTTPDGRKVKSTIHWVSATHALDCEVRLYDNLFVKENPSEVEEGQDFTANLNSNSLEILSGCKIEPSLQSAAPGALYQFERLGYFCADPDSGSESLVFNRTIGLRDTWSKIEKREKK